ILEEKWDKISHGLLKHANKSDELEPDITHIKHKMISKGDITMVNGVQDSVTLVKNKLKDDVCDNNLPQEAMKNNVTKIAKSPLGEFNGNSVMHSKGSYITPIQEFYKGTNIFITGGTGFLGKLLIEKLLYSCPHINMIYMLVRNKKGQSVESRAQEIFQDQLFDLFNVAATVRFDEKLEIAIQTNIQGTRDLMILCRDCRNIKVVIHVSTAYSHCYQNEIKEEFYDVPMTSDKAVKVVEALDGKILNNITPLLLGKWPNTYTYTKAIAEDAVRTYGKSLPVGIFRPSIVVSTKKEPTAGWIDNLYGPTGALVAVGIGMIRTLILNKNAVADLVPSDMTVNALISSAWDVYNRKRCGEEDIPIYNYVSSKENPIKWDEYIKMNSKHCWNVPFCRSVWTVFFIPCRLPIIFKFYTFFLHTFPAFIIDAVLYSIGQKPRLLKTYEKLQKFSSMVSYFTTRQWKFSNSNIQQLWKKLSPEDRLIYDFDFNNLQWDDYFRDTIIGVRTYILKEDPKTVPQAKRRIYR
ncbi:hypothetical protein L9F63_007033, partial [Diploptera punctata]